MTKFIDQPGTVEQKPLESVAYDPPLFYISPLQIWVGRLVNRAVAAETMQDVWLPVFSCASGKLREVFKKSRKKHGPKMAFLAQWEVGGLLLLSAALEIISVAASLSTPIVLRELLRHDRDVKLAWLLVFLSVTATLTGRARDQVSKIQAAYVDVMLQTAIFDKSLRLSPEARMVHPPAKIINLCNSDARSIGIYCGGIHRIWSCSLQLVLIAVLSNTIIGPSVLFGYLFLIAFFFLLSWVNKLTRAFMAQNIRLEDHRLAKIRELLINVKSVKALSYENVFRRHIGAVRDEQLAVVRRFLTAGWTVYSAINDSIPPGTASAAFIGYYLTGHQLEADVVFPALAYFNMLYSPLFEAAQAIAGHFAVLPSLRRVQELMAAEETRLDSTSPSDADSPGLGVAVRFRDSQFSYLKKYTDEDSTTTSTFKLELGDLDIPKNELTVIIGPTGSGKSSLLQAILGEMALIKGSCNVYGTLSYVGQDAWVMSGTLRDNIVFMQEYQAERYQEVIKLCGLDRDFRSMPKADLAQVGDAGSNLSGGQRSRVALARALYADTDILLLDDPLSAVDGNVRRLLFDTIRSLHKTVILVTLHTHLISLSDHLITFKDGRIKWQGSSKTLLTNKGFRSEYLGNVKANDDNYGTGPAEASEADSEDDEIRPNQVEDLIKEEERAKGAIKWRVLHFYLDNTGGLVQSIRVGLLALLLTGVKIISNYWFVWWVNSTFNLAQSQYLGVYLGLNMATSLTTALVGTGLVNGSIRASRSVHKIIIDNLLAAPLGFFQRQPVGRILNRLTTDIKSLDTRMLNSFDQIIKSGASLIASLCLISSTSPVMITAVFPYLHISGWYLSRYRVCARELQRSLAILQSPVTAILSECLSSPASVKAYGAADFLVHKHGKALDIVLSGTILRRSLDTWLMFRAEMASVALLLLVALLTVYGAISGVLGGLALSLATTLTKNVYYVAWSLTDLEMQMNSIERLKTYHDDLPREGVAAGADPVTEPTNWPETGMLDIRSISLKYPSRRTPALNRITLKIRGGQRVGIVGRTGSGKSTFVSSISRLVDITSGTISLDGLNISSVQPVALRSSVHTLPQEPLIFEGTLRDNLDPERQYTDENLLDALEQCQIKSFFAQKLAGRNLLMQRLSSGGADLSAGQRQLLCAARLLLNRPKVLLVDEAAANVDSVSDEALQDALKSLPSETTMLIIAHRAGSLAWLDRIIVMSGGRIIEDDTPLALLETKAVGNGEESYYRQAVKHEGEAIFQQALATARRDRS